jgi:hypothetical protein
MPGDPGGPVVTTLVCFVSITAREAAGASCARHSPRPYFSWGEEFMHSPDAIAPRECALLSQCRTISQRHCEERLRRSNPAFCFAALWIASLTLAMTIWRYGCLKFRLTGPQTYSSCPDLIRASIRLPKSLLRKRWIAGSSPAMTPLRVRPRWLAAHLP